MSHTPQTLALLQKEMAHLFARLVIKALCEAVVNDNALPPPPHNSPPQEMDATSTSVQRVIASLVHTLKSRDTIANTHYMPPFCRVLVVGQPTFLPSFLSCLH